MGFCHLAQLTVRRRGLCLFSARRERRKMSRRSDSAAPNTLLHALLNYWGRGTVAFTARMKRGAPPASVVFQPSSLTPRCAKEMRTINLLSAEAARAPRSLLISAAPSFARFFSSAKEVEPSARYYWGRRRAEAKMRVDRKKNPGKSRL